MLKKLQNWYFGAPLTDVGLRSAHNLIDCSGIFILFLLLPKNIILNFNLFHPKVKCFSSTDFLTGRSSPTELK